MAPYKNQQQKPNKRNKVKQKNPNHQYLKQLKHAVKATKSFEVQKTIRKLKEEVNTNESSSKKEVLENKIRCLKLLNVNDIAQECLNSIVGTDDSIDEKGGSHVSHYENEGGDKDKDNSDQINKDKEIQLQLINSIKRHSRCMKAINDIKKSIISSSNRQHLSKHRLRGNKPNSNTPNNNTSLLFVESLSGRPNDAQLENNSSEGDDDDDASFSQAVQLQPTKTNRPGQRARKAKKLAIQLKEEGTTWDNSMNWREKKERKDDTNEKKKRPKTNNDVKIIAKASDVAVGKDWKTKADSQHPSWLAASRPEKSATILPFAGKKITFDD